ncbi:MAG TPA: DNA polymerase, partial [Ignavibacteriaceae bacterium]
GLLRRLRRFPTCNLTAREEKEYRKSVLCHICELPLDGDSVRDHDHATNQYLGSAHQACNLNRCVEERIPLYAHNLQKYDSHFLIAALSKKDKLWRLDGLPLNTQHFRTLQINSFHLVDTLSFLSASLAELVEDLSKNKHHPFYILDQMQLYHRGDEKKKTLLLRKGVCPYEVLKDYDMLLNTKELPAHDAFFSSLSNSNISQEEYIHGKTVFKAFECENLLQYLEIYCYTDVALLAEVMLQFRYVVQSEFGIDCW